MIRNLLDFIKNLENVRIVKSNEQRVWFRAIKGCKRIWSFPIEINEDLAYFLGFVIGDGHLQKNDYRIFIEIADREKIIHLLKLTNKLFDVEEKIYLINDKREDRKQRYRIDIRNKVIHQISNKIFEIPIGKKSNIVRVPNLIQMSNKIIKLAFIKGIMDSDGGFHSKGRGLSTASEVFRDQFKNMLEEFNIKVYKDKWLNKKYNRTYYGLYFNKMRELPS